MGNWRGMCGRYTLHQSAAAITERFAIARGLFALEPRYNIAPAQRVAVVLAGGVLDGYDWGWAPHGSGLPGRGSRWINARAETLAEKPAFRRAFASQRCLIPADGFYEWQATGERRCPWHFRLRDGGLFAFAGLWEERSTGRACVLITVSPNALVAPVHDRMPAMLEPDFEARWLDPAVSRPLDLLPLLAPYPAERLEGFRVSPRVNSPRVDDAGCLERDLTIENKDYPTLPWL